MGITLMMSTHCLSTLGMEQSMTFLSYVANVRMLLEMEFITSLLWASRMMSLTKPSGSFLLLAITSLNSSSCSLVGNDPKSSR